MADWEVQLITKDGQIKTVKVYDYNYPSDAESAALSQTGGQRIIWSSPFTATKETPNTSQNTNSNTSRSYDYSNIEFDYSTKEGLIVGYIAAAILPTILLWCINPIPAILFNIAFARWWFTS
jgi:hypothetical protein